MLKCGKMLVSVLFLTHLFALVAGHAEDLKLGRDTRWHQLPLLGHYPAHGLCLRPDITWQDSGGEEEERTVGHCRASLATVADKNPAAELAKRSRIVWPQVLLRQGEQLHRRPPQPWQRPPAQQHDWVANRNIRIGVNSSTDAPCCLYS